MGSVLKILGVLNLSYPGFPLWGSRARFSLYPVCPSLIPQATFFLQRAGLASIGQHFRP
jgi:hypothetical protein